MFVLKRLSFPKNRKMVVSVISGILVFFVLFLVVLSPTRKELADKKKKWREIEVQLKESRGKIDNFKVDKAGLEAKVEELRRRLPKKSSTSAILEELTKKGKQLNIDFVSISPQPEEPVQQVQQLLADAFKLKLLPISIEMKATYKSLGEYLGEIENLESSFATVNEFQVTKDDRIFPKLMVNMRIYTYALEEAESGQK